MTVFNQIDALYELYGPLIAQRQADYFSGNDQYFQGLQTHSTIPSDGASLPPDLLDDTPHDQPEAWPLTEFPAILPCAIRIDTYYEASGHGYVTVLMVIVAGDEWQRHINIGPQTWRERNWFNVSEL